MVHAMTERERPLWAVRLQAERETRQWSKAEMGRRLRRAISAEHTPLNSLTRQIRDWENGKHFPRDWRTAYATAFEMDETELFGPRSAARSSRLAAGSASLLGIEGVLGLNGRSVDAGYVEAIRETNQALVRLDALWGGDEVLPLALRVFRTAHHKLGAGAYAPEVERDLMAATGETGEVTAWLAYDADRQDVSRQLIHEAMLLSRQAGDRDMELFDLSHLAMQSLYLLRPAEALRITDDVLDAGRLAPRVAALFEMRRGRALAQMGDEQRALDALDKASAALGDGVGARDPHWTWWVDGTEITWHKATARTQLGQWTRAVPLYERVAADCRGGSSYGKLDLAQLLEALVEVGDWRRAEDIATEAVGLAGSIGPGRAANLFRKVVARIVRNNVAPSTVSDTAEYLRRLLCEEPGQGGRPTLP
jgi:tetratricopeptide (TPR) repeat protein